MDIQLEKKKGIRKKHIPYIAGGALFLLLLGWIIFGDHSSTLKIDARGISIGAAKQDLFHDFVRVDGQVQPITVVQLSPQEGGIVEEKVIEEGSQVSKGDVIVRLSNSQLDLQILSAEAELAEKQNFLRNTQVAMEQDKLNNQNEQLSLELETTRKRRAFQQQEQLYKENLIAKEEYLQAKEDYDLAIKKYELISARLLQDSIMRTVQIDQMEDNLANMRKNVLLVRQRKENLNIRSQINGELGLLDVVLGQNISPGQKIGQVNDLSDYKIEALIDEHYIDRVRTGLSATFERQGASYGLIVRKVFPEVREGKFRTEFVFTGERPENIRSGQTYYINLELGQPAEGILIPKGTFFQSTGGSWIFVLDADGKKAYRRNIRIGRQNPQYYEVLEGLEAGEKVIVSSYESYKDNQVLILE
ncbi:HlyD family secretion protein [Parabacteroides sp. PF5-5]|uniref:efflux RND transporter periplasmic adaptor subunit n=1 Tax=unclassified Parabacteroides TaxID=2649774 RepID=UPI0024748792|nr:MULTISPECIES: HlyD family efflux transporter periplasmic adaptor subunit [unclassified Parabacteroides]MDH6306498.1 HlyD family secretion protein [Parabacteroides sp. PH5-39]MDH6317465.1 HlyD family secretion protein [Parabacteroides sp. PF5-13]MDH6321232.1 HlyD family secretion protein [Parabacteroides sp. PH5-13]MDH6324964.1 HlyD family secretion protein [Parabacteroides sp. PH5-8]MDH6328673.1 HlyD family secretion protein [Parabacteroides sp. PH5-41]